MTTTLSEIWQKSPSEIKKIPRNIYTSGRDDIEVYLNVSRELALKGQLSPKEKKFIINPKVEDKIRESYDKLSARGNFTMEDVLNDAMGGRKVTKATVVEKPRSPSGSKRVSPAGGLPVPVLPP